MDIIAYMTWLWLLGGPPVCSIEVNPFSVGSSDTYFWGVFGSETVQAPAAGHPVTQRPGHYSVPDTTPDVWGQIVYVHDAAGEGAGQLALDDSRSWTSAAVVVLWDYDAGCEPTPFDGPEPWGFSGASAYFLVSPRDREDWAYGLPTFDAYYAGQTIYPFAATRHGLESIQARREFWEEHGDPLPEPPRLSPQEVFELLQVLPFPCDYVHDLESASNRLREAIFDWSTKVTYRPADRIFEKHVDWRDHAGPAWADNYCSESHG